MLATYHLLDQSDLCPISIHSISIDHSTARILPLSVDRSARRPPLCCVNTILCAILRPYLWVTHLFHLSS
jgi:hypothetical protein